LHTRFRRALTALAAAGLVIGMLSAAPAVSAAGTPGPPVVSIGYSQSQAIVGGVHVDWDVTMNASITRTVKQIRSAVCTVDGAVVSCGPVVYASNLSTLYDAGIVLPGQVNGTSHTYSVTFTLTDGKAYSQTRSLVFP
jgi:hypothetical protein